MKVESVGPVNGVDVGSEENRKSQGWILQFWLEQLSAFWYHKVVRWLGSR